MAFIKPRNKKGDIAVTILVIEVFALCSLAIVNFLLYKQQIQGGFVNMEIFTNLSSEVENYYFYINSGLSPQQAATNIGAQLQGNQLILNVEQKADLTFFGSITGSKSDTIISVKYIVDLTK